MDDNSSFYDHLGGCLVLAIAAILALCSGTWCFTSSLNIGEPWIEHTR
jgi:hypothetical protein